MYNRFNSYWKSIFLSVLIISFLAGCEQVPVTPDILPSATKVILDVVIQDPESARDIVLAYIRTYHPGTGPSENAYWFDDLRARPDFLTVDCTGLAILKIIHINPQ